jgi:hypothetical protein
MFSDKDFYTKVIAPLSIIRATDWFEARILELCSAECNWAEVRKTLQPGLRLKVEYVLKPFDHIDDGGLLCRFHDKEVERTFFRSILPQEYRDTDYIYNHRLDIEWDVFNSSFEVENLFNINYLDYRNPHHLEIAIQQYRFDFCFPLKIPKNAIEEINRIYEEKYSLGYITENELTYEISTIVCKSLGFYN